MLRKLLGNGRSLPKPAPVVNVDCLYFEVNNWVLSDFVIRSLLPFSGVSPFPLNELLLMSGAFLRFRPRNLFEWGTHIGVSARIWYTVSQAFLANCTIHTIDLPDDVRHVEHPGHQYAHLIRHIPQIQKYRGDGLDISCRLARALPASDRLMFFLDGDHSYDSVHRELETIIREFPEACILVHDTFYQDPSSGYNTGPNQALNDTLKSVRPKYQVIKTDTGLPGMTLLYPHDE